MSMISGYRSLIAGALVAAAMLTQGGCSLDGRDRNAETRGAMKRGYEGARLAIVIELATQQYRAGEYEKCRETLAGAMIAAGGQSAPLNVLAAKLEIEKGNLDVAYGHLKNALLLDGSNAETYFLLGVVYQRWQKSEQALENYTTAWEKKGSEPGYLLAVVEMLITLNRLDEAQKALESNMDYFEQTSAVRVAMGKLYSLKHDYATAAKYYRDAVVLSPEDLGLRLTYGEALYFGGKYADALPVLEDLKANKSFTDKGSLAMLLGRTYLALHRNSDARFCFQDLTQENPSNIVAWLSLGRVYLQENEPALTIQTSMRVLKIDPKNSQAMILKALAEQKQQRWKQAVETLELALASNPKDTTVMCMLGLNAQREHNDEKAIGFFSQAVAVNPQDAWAMELLTAVRPQPVKVETPVLTPAPKQEEPKVEEPAVKVEEESPAAPVLDVAPETAHPMDETAR